MPSAAQGEAADATGVESRLLFFPIYQLYPVEGATRFWLST